MHFKNLLLSVEKTFKIIVLINLHKCHPDQVADLKQAVP